MKNLLPKSSRLSLLNIGTIIANKKKIRKKKIIKSKYFLFSPLIWSYVRFKLENIVLFNWKNDNGFIREEYYGKMFKRNRISCPVLLLLLFSFFAGVKYSKFLGFSFSFVQYNTNVDIYSSTRSSFTQLFV